MEVKILTAQSQEIQEVIQGVYDDYGSDRIDNLVFSVSGRVPYEFYHVIVTIKDEENENE